jgi:ABC-type molybdate transport system permease subunit
MSETEILITYGGVVFLLLTLIFVYAAFAKANHEPEEEEMVIASVLCSFFWPITLPLAIVGLCAALIVWFVSSTNDALARCIRRKSK